MPDSLSEDLQYSSTLRAATTWMEEAGAQEIWGGCARCSDEQSCGSSNFELPFTLSRSERQHAFSASRRLKLLGKSAHLLLANFENYFNGFASQIGGSILDDLKFCYQFTTLSESSAIGAAIGNLLEPEFRPRSPRIDNDSMDAPFAEVVRKFNLKYNKKTGENQTG
jgi:hypothetical protein